MQSKILTFVKNKLKILKIAIKKSDIKVTVTKNEVNTMDFRFDDSTLLEHKNNKDNETNSYMIISKSPTVEEADLQNVIQIIDESGNEVTCTYDKFLEIFDKQDLEGFIM